MRAAWAGVTLVASLAACGSLPLVGDDSGVVDSSESDVVQIPDIGVEAAPDAWTADADATTPLDASDGAPYDAPPPPPPPLWWEQTPATLVTGVAVDSNLNVLVAGSSPALIEEYDSIGNPIWKATVYSTSSSSAQTVAFDHVGSMYAVGFTQGTLNLGGSDLVGPGSFVVKYDSSGAFKWQLGPFASANFNALAVTSNNDLIVCGTLNGTQNFGGGVMATTGGYDALMLDFDSSGSFVRSKLWGDIGQQNVKRCAVDSNDNLLLIGEFEGSVDFGGGTLTGASYGSMSNTGGANIYVAKLDSSAGYLAAVEFKSSASNASGIAVDGSGSVFVTGETRTSLDLGGGTLTNNTMNYSVFFGRLSSSLGYGWGKIFGAITVWSGGVAVDTSGNPIFIGSFAGDVDFGCGKLSTANNQCGFVTKTDTSGSCVVSGTATGSSCNVNPYGIAFMSPKDWAIVGQGGASFPGLPPVGGGFVIRWAP